MKLRKVFGLSEYYKRTWEEEFARKAVEEYKNSLYKRKHIRLSVKEEIKLNLYLQKRVNIHGIAEVDWMSGNLDDFIKDLRK